MENKNIRVDGGHFRGLTRPVHADGGAVPCHPTKCRPVPLEGRHFSRETFEKTASPPPPPPPPIPPPPTESRQRQQPANIPSNRYESGLPNLRLVARKARRYNDFRRELCVATFQLFVSFLVSSFAYVEFVSVFTSETRLSSKFWIDRYNFSFLLNVLHNEKKLYSFFNDS